MSRILVVDDDSQVLQVVSEMLRIEGHEVVMAANGRQAIDQFENGPFDLVVTDIIMPEQEGLETIANLRRRESYVPIIAISGGGRAGNLDYLETARYIGADGTLAKPFGRQDLLDKVNQVLSDTAERTSL
jgi:CheY-like chemotaxis protein